MHLVGQAGIIFYLSAWLRNLKLVCVCHSSHSHSLSCKWSKFFDITLNISSFRLREMGLSKIVWLAWLERESWMVWHKNIIFKLASALSFMVGLEVVLIKLCDLTWIFKLNIIHNEIVKLNLKIWKESLRLVRHWETFVPC